MSLTRRCITNNLVNKLLQDVVQFNLEQTNAPHFYLVCSSLYYSKQGFHTISALILLIYFCDEL